MTLTNLAVAICWLLAKGCPVAIINKSLPRGLLYLLPRTLLWHRKTRGLWVVGCGLWVVRCGRIAVAVVVAVVVVVGVGVGVEVWDGVGVGVGVGVGAWGLDLDTCLHASTNKRAPTHAHTKIAGFGYCAFQRV